MAQVLRTSRKRSSTHVTRAFLTKVLLALAKGIATAINERLAPMEARIAQLEQKPVVKYAGIWQQSKTYPEGSLITHAGGLWLATETTSGTPGTDASGFRLVVKRGAAV